MQTDAFEPMCNPAHMSPDQMAQAAYIRAAAAAKGESPSRLAVNSGLAASTLTRLLNGQAKNALTFTSLSKVSRYSGVPIPTDLRMIPLVAFVGAGAVVYPFEDGDALDFVSAPPGAEESLVAVIVKGDSMRPALWEGDVLFYTRDAGFDRAECLYQECVVKVVDGGTYVKVIEPGGSSSTFNLSSFNAPTIYDADIEWAAPVLHVDRTRRYPNTSIRGLLGR